LKVSLFVSLRDSIFKDNIIRRLILLITNTGFYFPM